MIRYLKTEDNERRVLAPTDTITIARRMLVSSQIVSDVLPKGFGNSPGLEILLTLYIAEDEACYLHPRDLKPSGICDPKVSQRWVAALKEAGLIEEKSDLIALTTLGDDTVTHLVTTIFQAQRALD